MRSSPIRAEEQAWRNGGQGEGMVYEATPQKKYGRKQRVKLSSSLLLKPDPPWWNKYIDTVKMVQSQLWKLQSCHLCWDFATTSCALWASGIAAAAASFAHLGSGYHFMMQIIRSSKARAGSLLMGCHSIPTGLAFSAPGCLYEKKMAPGLLYVFCGVRRNPKPHFSAPLDGGEVWKINLCLQALWKVHGFSGSSRSTPVEFLERKNHGSHSDTMVSSPRNLEVWKDFG